MKKNLFFSLLLFPWLIYAQKKSDVGISSGASYYLGDINPGRQFYSPHVFYGLVWRYNLNPRYVIKGTFTYIRVSATDADFTDPYQLIRRETFSTSLYDLGMQFEFNFLPYKFAERKIGLSPFVSAGVGVAYQLGVNLSKSINPVLPFTAGIKFSIYKRWSAGWEWSFRKTFNDNLDGNPNRNIGSSSTLLHNNDWYSYSGLFVAYKIFDTVSDCPAYEKER